MHNQNNPGKVAHFQIHSNGTKLSGYPFSITVTLNKVSVHTRRETHFQWHANMVELKARPWRPKHLTLYIPFSNVQHFQANLSKQLEIDTKLITIDTRFDRTWHLNGVHIVIKDPDFKSYEHSLALRADTLSMAWTRSNKNYKTDNWHILASANNLRPSNWRIKKNWHLNLQKLEATVAPTFSFGPIKESIAQWKDAGGTINIREMMVIWGKLGIHVDGTLTVDDQYRPLGAFKATTESFIPLINQLEENDLISFKQAMIAKVASIAAAKRPGSESLHIPITAQFGRLFVGPLAIAELPTLETLMD